MYVLTFKTEMKWVKWCPKQQINQKQDLNTSSFIMGTNPSTLLSKAGTGSLCRDVCHTLWGACKSVHCCMCLEHNKGRHSPLGAMNRTRSFSFYPWCPARVCLARAAMLSVWKLGAAANRGWNPSPSASSTCE